jgi:hypothetical protein
MQMKAGGLFAFESVAQPEPQAFALINPQGQGLNVITLKTQRYGGFGPIPSGLVVTGFFIANFVQVILKNVHAPLRVMVEVAVEHDVYIYDRHAVEADRRIFRTAWSLIDRLIARGGSEGEALRALVSRNPGRILSFRGAVGPLGTPLTVLVRVVVGVPDKSVR